MQRSMNFPVVPLADVPVIGLVRSSDKKTILVVDDEHVIADTLVQIFNQSGYLATAAYSGDMALALAGGAAPDLLITDVVMPGMSGIDLAIAMQTLCPKCKVILFSGQASTVDLLASARAAGHAFQTLSKPIHPVVMLGRVSELLPSQTFAGVS